VSAQKKFLHGPMRFAQGEEGFMNAWMRFMHGEERFTHAGRRFLHGEQSCLRREIFARRSHANHGAAGSFARASNCIRTCDLVSRTNVNTPRTVPNGIHMHRRPSTMRQKR
jgi:hypothetical protein